MTHPQPPHDEEVAGPAGRPVPGAPPLPPALEREEPEFNAGEQDVASDAPDPDLEPVHPNTPPQPPGPA